MMTENNISSIHSQEGSTREDEQSMIYSHSPFLPLDDNNSLQ